MAVLLFLSLLLSADHALAGPSSVASGNIVSLTGAVSVRRKLEGKIASKPAKLNESLYEGDLIATGNDGSLKAILNDDSVMDLGPNGVLRIDRYQASGTGDRTAVLSLLYGKLRALVTKAVNSSSTMEVRTPTAVMGVRGTEFIVNATQGGAQNSATQVTVLTGAVELTMPKLSTAPVMISAGTQYVADPTKPMAMQPTTMSQAQAESAAADARIQDNTFDRTVTLEKTAQTTDAPPAATTSVLFTPPITLAAKDVTAEQTEALAPRVQGTFGLQDRIQDTPTMLLPAIFQQISVKFAR